MIAEIDHLEGKTPEEIARLRQVAADEIGRAAHAILQARTRAELAGLRRTCRLLDSAGGLVGLAAKISREE